MIVVDWLPTISCQPLVIGDWVTGQFYEASQPPKKSRLGTLIVPDKVLTEVLRHLRCSASFLSWNQILPKRKGPTDLQTLHSRNVMHQSRWGPCKMPCAVQCAIVQGALMHCVVGGELVLGCALRLKHSDVPCADALMRSLVDDELN